MFDLIRAVLAAFQAFFRSRLDTSLEILALRQQVAVLKRRRRRPSLNRLGPPLLDHAAEPLVAMVGRSGRRETSVSDRMASSGLSTVLALAIPATPRSAEGERRGSDSYPMTSENSDWGAPKIHGELLKLGFEVSERTVARYLRRLRPRRGDPAQHWVAFLANYREAIVAFDFFTVPTLTFRLLYCFFVIDHGRRKVLHCNVTFHPTSEWVVQQLRETFPEADPYRYVIFDHDSKFNADAIALLKSTGLEPKRTSVQSPWQNGIAERWVGSCRRELLEHVIPLNERHLRRLLREYVTYHNEDRLHDSLNKDAPNRRPVEHKPSPLATVTSCCRLDGLHHRYGWSVAA